MNGATMSDQPMRKFELRGASKILAENATAQLVAAKTAGCSPAGHSNLVDGTMTVGRMIEAMVEYQTNGASVDYAEAASDHLMPKVGVLLTDAEKRIIAACQTPARMQAETAFRVGKRDVSNAAYKRLMVGLLSAMTVATSTLTPIAASSCSRSAATADQLEAEKRTRIAQFQAAQSNMLVQIERLANAVATAERRDP